MFIYTGTSATGFECVYPRNSYLSGSVCSRCDPSCSACSGPSASNCVTCNSDYFNNSIQCSACDLSCKTCNGSAATQCLSCNSGSFLYPDNSCRTSCVLPLVTSDNGNITLCQNYDDNNIKTISSLTYTGGVIMTAALISWTAASLGNSLSFTMIALSRMIFYIEFFNLNYSDKLTYLLQTQQSNILSFNFNINPPDALTQRSMYNDTPPKFEEYQVYGSFLYNYWNQLLFILLLGLIIIFLRIIEWSANKLKLSASTKSKSQGIRLFEQNLLFICFYSGFGDIVFFSALEFRSSKYEINSSLLSFIMGILLLVAELIIFVIHIRIIKQYQRIKSVQSDVTSRLQTTRTENSNNSEAMNKFMKQNQGLQVLFQDYKDDTLFQHGFLLVFVIRYILFNLIIIILYQYPLCQAILIVLLSSVMLIYLITKRPFRTRSNEVQQLLLEGLLFVVNICVLITAIEEDGNEEVTSIVDNVCNIIIYLGTIFNYVPLAFFIWNGIITYIEYRLRKKALLVTSIAVVQDSDNRLQLPDQSEISIIQTQSFSNTKSKADESSTQLMKKGAKIKDENRKYKRQSTPETSLNSSQDTPKNQNDLKKQKRKVTSLSVKA